MVLFTGAARVRLFVRALPCAWLVSARVVARLCGTVCWLCPALSHVAGLLRFVLFVGYCVGVRFVSAPASGVTWFMSFCVGARLTATVIVAYYLLCNDASSGLHYPRVCPSFS